MSAPSNKHLQTYRLLTPNEFASLKAGLWPRSHLGIHDLKLILVMAGGGTLLSTPFAIIFFCAAKFLHGEQLYLSIQIGLLGLVPGLILGLLFAAVGIIGANKPSIPNLKQDLANGKCIVETYQANRAYELVDDGNVNDPDLLLYVNSGYVLAIPAHDAKKAGNARQNCSICKLPLSKALVSVEFSGDRIPKMNSIVETNNLWRNDDLPWYELISLSSTLPALRRALDNVA